MVNEMPTQEEQSEEAVRQKLKDALIRLADYVRENRIKTIVAVGPSAVHSARALRTVYNKKHPGDKLELHALGRIADEFDLFVRQHDLEKAAKLIRQRRRKLVSRLQEPLMLFDEEAFTGETMKNAEETFKKHLGARQPHTAVLVAAHVSSYPFSVVGYREKEGEPVLTAVEPVHSARGAYVKNLNANVNFDTPAEWRRRQKHAREYWSQLAREI